MLKSRVETTRRRVMITAIVAVLTALLPLYSQTFTRVDDSEATADAAASRSVNWIDFDKDGLLDLFVSNGLSTGQNNMLFRNEGPPTFQFTKITGGALVMDGAKSDGSSWGDFDNDGDVDAFVVNWYNDNNLLYANEGGGSFVQILEGALVNDRGLSETCSWGDYDNDGHLDLYVTNSGNAGVAQRNFLYRNNGDGTFTSASSDAVVSQARFTRGANWVDYDGDGDLDLFLANEENQNNELYQNLRTETGVAIFSQIATGDIVNNRGASWSGSWGDYDNDGDLDLFVANWRNQNNFLYRNLGDGSFERVTEGVLVNDQGFSASSGWGDYDNDGDLDLFVTSAYGSGPLTNSLYRNLLIESGSADFEKITGGPVVNDTGNSYGFSWGDYDQDGDLDLYIAKTLNESEPNALYRNDNANGNHWLELDVRGVVSNRSGIGATIRVKALIGGEEVWQMREVSGQSGYCGQNLRVHFGLGDATHVDSLIIEWPSGTVDLATRVTLDRLIMAEEGNLQTSIRMNDAGGPHIFELSQNYPNPFNPSTTIRYVLSRPQMVSLKVFDLLGNEVATLVEGFQSAGTHEVDFRPQGQQGSGVFFYSLATGDFRLTRKLVYVE